MGNTATPISEVSEPKDDPKALIANEIETLLQKGKELQDSKHFEEAGEVYTIIAQLKEKQCVDYYGLTIMYQTSATCYFEAKSRKAIDSCERAIDAILNDGRIDLGIGHCFKYGHVIQLNLGDAEKKEELFNRGDQLRIQHNITHSCPMKKVEESEIRNDKQKVLQELRKENAGWFWYYIPNIQIYAGNASDVMKRFLNMRLMVNQLTKRK
ncbi:hypothetical protein RF11_03040 [Thelohanellus kitauei]|uniref:Uncharacterized protein n=1 Tax=Thelohanellus kitauei TaxID=669202 RepID=A0A0C2MXC9_THEKT|nr:hypothetical protein RF11_03040 [Thelohanellus kitauei]